MDALLDPILAPTGTFDLVRLGRDHDGGCLVDRPAALGARRLISFGLNDDWSFESDFRRLNAVPVDIFDHTVKAGDFLSQALGALARPDRPGTIMSRFRTWISYRNFMRDPVRHHRKAIGYDTNSAKSLTSVIADLPPDARQGIFLKIDIEGWEYRLLDDLVTHAAKLEGLAIEFHDVDLHLDRLEAFVRRFPLHLCHAHANNYSRAAPNDVPMSLELSFSRYPAGSKAQPTLPHPLDQPNNPTSEEFHLRFRPRAGRPDHSKTPPR